MFARQVAETIRNTLETPNTDKNYRIYNEAMWQLFLTKPETLLYLMESACGNHDVVIHFRNHLRDKKGKLKSCEAYLVRLTTQTIAREL